MLRSPRQLHLADLPILDPTLALVLLVLSLGAILTGEVSEGPRSVTIPVALVTSAAVAVRARWTLAAAVAVALAGLAQSLLGAESPGTLMALVAILLVVYSAGAECDEGTAALGLTAMLGSALLEEWLDHATDYAFVTIELGGIWLLGRAVRSWRSRATYAEQHQRDLARLAVAEERTRIARELHDVVAHSLSVIAVQADAAEAALAVAPSRAGESLRAIRGSAREALGDMRQMLYLLRVEDLVDADRAPARGVADLPRLVAGMQEAGLTVNTQIDVPEHLPSGLGLAAYRIAQEGLTNVRRHAGTAPTRLLVQAVDCELRVEVHNDPPHVGSAAPPGRALSTGHGLIGARERAHAAGGSLDAGPTLDGGYRLVARLPLGGVAR